MPERMDAVARVSPRVRAPILVAKLSAGNSGRFGQSGEMARRNRQYQRRPCIQRRCEEAVDNFHRVWATSQESLSIPCRHPFTITNITSRDVALYCLQQTGLPG